MTRQDFLFRLRHGLRGLPSATVDEIVADYDGHFSEGAAAGRDPVEMAAALGDPDRLARELRAEAGLKRWETERNPSAAANALFAILGLGAIDVLVLLPIVMPIGGTLLGFAIAAVVGVVAGAVLLVAGPVLIHGAPLAAIILTGLGVIAGSVCIGAVVAIVSIGLTNALVWFGRLHMRLLGPALRAGEIAV